MVKSITFVTMDAKTKEFIERVLMTQCVRKEGDDENYLAIVKKMAKHLFQVKAIIQVSSKRNGFSLNSLVTSILG